MAHTGLEPLRQLREIFWRYRSQPVQSVVTLINPILRGWVNYFAIGHSSRCFNSSNAGWSSSSGAISGVPGIVADLAARRGTRCDYTPRLACSMAIRCVRIGVGRSVPISSHNPCCEPHTRAQCDNPARCVRCGGGWKRGRALPSPTRQSSTLPYNRLLPVLAAATVGLNAGRRFPQFGIPASAPAML